VVRGPQFEKRWSRGRACWPLVPKFAVSNPAEAVGLFRAKKSSACLPSEGNKSGRSVNLPPYGVEGMN
jgi:hypothetical protein